jgi:hypothetical protein
VPHSGKGRTQATTIVQRQCARHARVLERREQSQALGTTEILDRVALYL